MPIFNRRNGRTSFCVKTLCWATAKGGGGDKYIDKYIDKYMILSINLLFSYLNIDNNSQTSERDSQLISFKFIRKYQIKKKQGKEGGEG